MRQVIPVLIVVFLLLLVADMLIKPEWIKHNLGNRTGIKGWFITAIGGVLATGPIYPWYALLQELHDEGMRTSLAVVLPTVGRLNFPCFRL